MPNTSEQSQVVSPEEQAVIELERYQIGYRKEGAVMVLTIPLRKWSSDTTYGDILISGFFKKAERIALKNLEMMRREAAEKQPGIVQPGVIPMPGARRVN